MLGLPLSIGGSLLLAIVLSQKLRGIIVYRTVFYLPTVTNGVALFLLWKWLYNPNTASSIRSCSPCSLGPISRSPCASRSSCW